MPKVCDITGKRPRVGNKVSHANNKTKRRFDINLQFKKFYVPETKSWIFIRACTSVIRTSNQKGIFEVIQKAKRKGTLNKTLIHYGKAQGK